MGYTDLWRLVLLTSQAFVHLTHPIEDKGTTEREKYTLPKIPTAATPEASSSGTPSCELDLATQSDPLQIPSALTIPSALPTPPEEPVSQPSKSQKGTSRPVATKKPKKSPAQVSVPGESTSRGMMDISQNTFTPAPIPPAPGNAIDPPPSAGVLGATDADMALVATAFNVHQILSQVAAGLEVPQGPPVITESPDVVEPIGSTVHPSQLSINPSQADTNLSRPPLGSSPVPVEIVSINPTTNDPAPKTQYRVRIPADAVSGVRTPSRRNSIDGAPEVCLDLRENSMIPPSQDFAAALLEVDISKYMGLFADSDNETHVSSSQKSFDGCDSDPLPPLPPRTQLNVDLSVDEEDLPAWMLKKGQWKYVASTPGGPAWENLLKIYMDQERRLEFTDKVSN